MVKLKIGDRVVDTHPNAGTTDKSGVLMEHSDHWLVWVQFDDAALNNTDCSGEFGAGTHCTACHLDGLVLESEFNK